MDKRGFTLLEVLVSATIIAVLTVIGVVAYSSVNKRSRDVKRKSDLEQIRSALEMYRSDNGQYPQVSAPSATKTDNLIGSLVSGAVQYMPAVPKDSDTDQDYWYQAVTTTSYCLWAVILCY